MAANSKIEWTDASWTPIRARNRASGKIGWHCEHASPGCINCYSEGINRRLGTGLPFKPGHRQDIDIVLDDKMLLAPTRWRKPRMIFVCSMTDLFADFVPDKFIDRVFAVMALCQQHTFQVLTKRSERMLEYFRFAWNVRSPAIRESIVWLCKHVADPIETPAAWRRALDAAHANWPLPNVWLGVSVEDQRRADERIPHLLQTPAAVRFVSAEPLIGPLDLKWLLDWVIVGGESGTEARPFQLEWADSLTAQCKAAGVPCFVKQLGANSISDGYPLHLKNRKGGDPAEWPERLRIRQMPGG